MNFNIVESRSVDRYPEFVDLYHQNISREQIKKILGIGGHQYNKYYQRAKQNNDIKISKRGRKPITRR